MFYTYDLEGKPVWYTAQSELSSENGITSFKADLLFHKWDTGLNLHDSYTKAGQISFTVNAPREISAEISVNNITSTLELVPFGQSNTSKEAPKTGLWFNPENSGYGFTYIEQHRWRTAIYYFYDESGKPTWLFGTNGSNLGESHLSFSYREQQCLGCTLSSSYIYVNDAGTLTFDFSGATQGLVTTNVGSNNWSFTKAPIQMLSNPESEYPSYTTLSQLESDEYLAEYLREGVLHLTGYNEDNDFSSGPGSPTATLIPNLSNANLQEAGVDELESLKVDDQCAFTFPTYQGQSIESYRVNEDGIVLSKSKFRKPNYRDYDGSIYIDDIEELGMYLSSTHAATISTTKVIAYQNKLSSAWQVDKAWRGGFSYVDTYRRDSCELRDMQRISLSGYMLANRRINDNLYLLWRSSIDLREIRKKGSLITKIQDATLEDLSPQIKVDSGPWKAVLNKDNTFVVAGRKNPVNNLVLLTRINLNSPSDIETIAVAGQIESLYVSTNAAYLASSVKSYRNAAPDDFSTYSYSTQIHKIALGQKLEYSASGSVDGYLDSNPDRARYRFSEIDGDLAIVTTYLNDINQRSHQLSIMTPSMKREGLLVYRSHIPNHAKPRPIGKPNELLKSTQFVGNKLYAVTFLQVDPLYIINMENLDAPYVEGELEVQGYSNYLHPLPNGKLLGIGRSEKSQGVDQGNQISLFDISNPEQPLLLQSETFGDEGSESAVNNSPLGFSYLPASSNRPARFAIPMSIYKYPIPSQPRPGSSKWQESGLYQFNLSSDYSSFNFDGKLITYSSQTSAVTNYVKNAPLSARSRIYNDQVIYYEGGRLWGASWGNNIPDYVP
ncbi:beta-propeller domain-containing protein [uncultured Pseudoteredinibacter sp.]|uniref:beta-propeller domain-containing protein n=1 Tax=uncultured Pseudoteredinibacter sp. TaxID=1641701 RepID=UPI0026096DB0|nr:beta-propeller domain-containing protein [uncultured Pseudoteredinibacter sp.]